MFWTIIRFAGLLLFALPLTAASRFQVADGFNIPWWVWVVVIAVLLLLSFAIILRFDWRDASNRPEDEEK